MNAPLSLRAMSPSGTPAWTEALRALRLRLWLILAIAVGTVLTTYIALQFIDDQYESTARLLVKLGRENVELPVTVEKGGLLSTGVRREEINSEIQLISSRPLIEATLDRIGLEAFKLEPPPPQTWFLKAKRVVRNIAKAARAQVKEALIALNLRPHLTEREETLVMLTRALAVEREKDSDVISVSVKLVSPDLAVKVADTLVSIYLDRRLDVRRDRGMSEFFDERLGALRQQLRLLDANKQQLRESRNVSGVDEERNLLLNRLQTLYAEIAIDQRELRMLGNTPAIAAAATPTAAGLSSYPNLEQLRGKITELRLRRTELLQRYTDNSESVQRVDREVAQIESTLQAALSAQLRERQAVAQSIERRLSTLNNSEVALEVIERDRLVLAQNYQNYAKKREEAQVSEALDLRRVSNVAVLSPALRPIEPVGTRKVLLFALALPFGLLAGIGLAMWLEYTNQCIRDEQDLPPSARVVYLGDLQMRRRWTAR